MDAEIHRALAEWLLHEVLEKKGPSPTSVGERNWQGEPGSLAIDNLVRELVPHVAEEIIATVLRLPDKAYFDAWPLLPDRIIGILMQAGASKYLPPVEVT